MTEAHLKHLKATGKIVDYKVSAGKADVVKKSKYDGNTINIEPIGLAYIKSALEKRGIRFATEHQFVKTRKFRFDVAVLNYMLAIEYEGIFTKGKSRHTNMMGYTKDCQKYNIGALEGWTLLRYTAKNYKDFDKDLVAFLMKF